VLGGGHFNKHNPRAGEKQLYIQYGRCVEVNGTTILDMYIKGSPLYHTPFKGDGVGVPFSVKILTHFTYSTNNLSFVTGLSRRRHASYVSSYSGATASTLNPE